MAETAVALEDRPRPEVSRRQERAGIALCLVAYFALRLWRLAANPINDKFDEGVYLSLMQGVAAGKGAFYQDYILCHPPGVLWVGAWLWTQVHGSLFALRVIVICFNALALLPIYAIARRFYGVRAALITLLLLTTSPGLANWLGSTVLLDLPLNVPLYTALWMLLCLPRRGGLTALGAGLLVGTSYLIKETALPAGLTLAAALFAASMFPFQCRVEGKRFYRQDALLFLVAFLLICAVLLAALSRLPNYLHYTFTLNANDVRNWPLRFRELQTGFFALPFLLVFGVPSVVRMAGRSRSPEERLLGVYAAMMSLFMLLVPKAFYWRYLTAALPIYALGVAVWWERFRSAAHSPAARRTVTVLAVVCGLAHLVSLVLYRTHEMVTPPAYQTALLRLQESPGPLFTLDPIWAASSGHPLTPEVQQLIKATIHLPVTHEEYRRVLGSCPVVLLNQETLRWLPETVQSDIRTHYRSLFRYLMPGESRYVEVLCQN